MPARLAVLALLPACSGMLDLPEEPRVSMESRAPLEPRPGHGASTRAGGAWDEPSSGDERERAPGAAKGSDVTDGSGVTDAPQAADAGAPAVSDDGGVELRSTSAG